MTILTGDLISWALEKLADGLLYLIPDDISNKLATMLGVLIGIIIVFTLIFIGIKFFALFKSLKVFTLAKKAKKIKKVKQVIDNQRAKNNHLNSNLNNLKNFGNNY